MDERKECRHYPFTLVSVQEEGRPENTGTLLDITRHGVAVRGLDAYIDDVRTLVVHAKKLFGLAPIRLDAVCRWVRTDQAEQVKDSGYEIVRISSADASELGELIRLLTFAGNEPEGEIDRTCPSGPNDDQR